MRKVNNNNNLHLMMFILAQTGQMSKSAGTSGQAVHCYRLQDIKNFHRKVGNPSNNLIITPSHEEEECGNINSVSNPGYYLVITCVGAGIVDSRVITVIIRILLTLQLYHRS